MNNLFVDFSFKISELVITVSDTIKVSFLVSAKDIPVRLKFSKGTILTEKKIRSSFELTKQSIIKVEPGKRKRFNFSFTSVKIKNYTFGTQFRMLLIDEMQNSILINFKFTSDHGWTLSSIRTKDPISDEIIVYNADKKDKGEVIIKRTPFEPDPIITDRKNVDYESTFTDQLTKNVEEALSKYSESKEDTLSPTENMLLNVPMSNEILKKISLDIIKEVSINGFPCILVKKKTGNNLYILIEPNPERLAELVEDELAWLNFQNEVKNEFIEKNEKIFFSIFLIPDDVAGIPIQIIEGSRNYERKYVFTPAEAINFISGMRFIAPIDAATDPLTVWTELLKPIHLSGILTNTYFHRNVVRYLGGENFDRSDSDKAGYTGKKTKIPQVKTVEAIELGDFREFCFGEKKDFEFGDVNLFCGANGSGKTSVLEAIEYGLTGKIHRINDFDLEMGEDYYPEISLSDSEGKAISFYPQFSSSYSKHIAQKWYGIL